MTEPLANPFIQKYKELVSLLTRSDVLVIEKICCETSKANPPKLVKVLSDEDINALRGTLGMDAYTFTEPPPPSPPSSP